MKILTAEEMRRADRLTTERTGVTFRQLMENAGRQVADFILNEVLTGDGPHAIAILCGKGNNGGDALVAARYLLQRGQQPRVYLLASASELKGDARANYDAFLEAGSAVQELVDAAAWERERASALDCEVLVDGLLGTGLSGPVKGLLAQVIADVNSRREYCVVAVDIPSGLPSDSGEPLGEAIRADATVTFTAPKRGLVFPPNCTSVGQLAVAPIGTPEALLAEDAELWLNLITSRQFAGLPLARAVTAHKGDFGHVLLVAGSRGKTGAAALGGRAAMRMGAGLVTVATPAGGQSVVASMVPEIMTEALPDTDTGAISSHALDYGRFAKLLEGKTVLAMGPGLTTHPETAQFVRAVLEQFDLPLVLDADALNALVGQLDALRHRRSRRVVLTPHPGEMARLLGTTTAEVQRQRIEVAQKFARDFDVFVILKGHRSLVAAPDGQVWVSPTGNPGMASGGTGDVLTGMVAGALAQFRDVTPAEAACLAVFLHGFAGDLAAGIQGEQGLIASDVIEALPAAWRRLRERIDSDDPERYYLVP
ncbi:MAG: NAD(P)H-hydrate dehydratase [Candidatus Acidiferrales bacterium]